ncbi:alpha/beta hydrolase fold domain-containing protein [Streptomyces sp. NBC_01003]|uniref:alpha/beta hydrolase fold domain-containing protein n=1 Tax=Streptomyces sp. NBC_01003 TaxID=2903714 RepID=UPI00386530A5|nr:alpha/beta hydrolase fold domain-containing protein [Streptomyces sp. NBC_01003]
MSSDTAPQPQAADLAAVQTNNADVMGRFMEGLGSAPPPPERIAPPPVRVVRDLVFSAPPGDLGPRELRMDLYLPEEASGPVPVIVWLPGGGWRTQRRGYGPRLTRLFAERGYAMADIEYRSSDLSPWPSQRDDVLAALRHLHTLADTHSLASDSIGLWGSSAGAHLALLAAFATGAGGEPAVPGIRAVVAGYPPTDLLHLDDDALPGGVLGVDPSDPAWGLLGGRPADRPEAAAEASPVRQVHPGVPPVLLMHGDADLLIGPAQSRRLHDALLAAGAESTLLLVHGTDHSFLNTGDWELRPMTATARSSRTPGTERTVRLTPALIERFFDHHLRSDPWNA